MIAVKKGRKPTGKPRAIRASVSLSPAIYNLLQDIANQKKVSVAWVIRDATDKYVAAHLPRTSSERS